MRLSEGRCITFASRRAFNLYRCARVLAPTVLITPPNIHETLTIIIIGSSLDVSGALYLAFDLMRSAKGGTGGRVCRCGGILRVRPEELDKALLSSTYRMRGAAFNSSDGLRGLPRQRDLALPIPL